MPDTPYLSSEDPRVLRKYMPELDVLRGIAILMVVLYHGLYWSGAVEHTHGIGRFIAQISVVGWLGVNLFFVLSGFLITGILIDTKKRDDYYHRFYWRRVLRILPVYLATIAILLLLHQASWKFAAVSLLFLANYSVPLHAGAGLAAFWSLSVEEQFYLVWPTVVRRLSTRILTWLATIICLVEPLLRWMAVTHRIPLTDVRGSTILIADNLACGALAAIFVRSRFGTRRYASLVGGLLILVGIAGELGGLRFGILHRDTVLGATFQAEPWNIFFTGLLLFFLSFRGIFAASAWTSPLRFFGYISYGLYLFHIIVFGLYDQGIAKLGPARVLLAGTYTRLLFGGGLAVLIAWLSRKFFEDRFLRIKVERGDKERVLLKQA